MRATLCIAVNAGGSCLQTYCDMHSFAHKCIHCYVQEPQHRWSEMVSDIPKQRALKLNNCSSTPTFISDTAFDLLLQPHLTTFHVSMLCFCSLPRPTCCLQGWTACTYMQCDLLGMENNLLKWTRTSTWAKSPYL